MITRPAENSFDGTAESSPAKQILLGRKFMTRPLHRVIFLGLSVLALSFFVLINWLGIAAQPMIQPNYSAQFQQPNNNNYLRNSSAFRQEIARFEITVHRKGKQPLSLSQVPRVQQGDVIKVKLLDEAVNGIKLDQSLFNWTMVVAFINPNRKVSSGGVGSRESRVESSSGSRQGAVSGKFGNSFVEDNSGGAVKNNQESSVSEEVNFRKKGWYKEHSFTVPYDSQPILFLYPRPNYRSKILNLINKNSKEIRELGAKTIELAGAYAQISSFLNELQGVISGNSYYAGGYGMGNTGFYGNSIGGFNPSIYNQYNRYNNNQNLNQPFNFNLFLAQAVERMSRGFNINLPNNCWQGSNAFANTNSSYGYNPYNNFNIINQQPTISPELVNRLQCVAKSIKLEDFDLSVSKLLQQGGMLLAVQLQQKYPQLSYWINVAALAIDLIVKIARKSPLRIVPAMSSSSDSPNSGTYGGYSGQGAGGSYGNNYLSSPNPNPQSTTPVKISVFAENQPDDNQAVTAYPIVLHKWQAEPDAEVISLRPPILAEPCLHAGVNILKSTDLTDEQLTDKFTKDYTLTMTSTTGFRKVFPLRKNLGLNGWELNITPQDLQEFPKIQMSLQSVISGTRGFNEIKSPPFFLPISIGGSWQITPETQREFTVGGKRRITIKNSLGNCQCLQAVIYKPSFGGQFVFESDGKDSNRLVYSPDGKEVSFEVDATNFQAGAGEIELRTYGGESKKLPLKLYGLPPTITALKINKGDREGIITGDRLEQITSLKINGRQALVIGGRGDTGTRGQNFSQPNSVTPQLPANSANFFSNLQTSNPNEKVVYFVDANTKLTENTASLELTLEDNRLFQVKESFPVAPSRPAIVSNQNREVEGFIIDSGKLIMDNTSVESRPKNGKTETKGVASKKPKLSTVNYQLSTKEVFPIDTAQISLSVQNALTDYDFSVENLSLETRLEKSGTNPNSVNSSGNNFNGETALPKVEFEVLDWKNLRITFQFSEGVRKLLGGRRLQFRIRDRERGDSDWYSIKQTFVRLPEISSITCTPEMNGMCEMKGASIDYISQVSTDGGQSWYPNESATLQVQPTADGQKSAMIPFLANKKLLLIKLRDFPKGDGLFVNNFVFTSSVKAITKPTPTVTTNQPRISGQVPNPTGQIPSNSNNQPPVNRIPESGKVKKKPKP